MTDLKRVTPRDLRRMLHDHGELALIDVREAGEFGESHLLFATPVPYSRLELEIVKLVPRKAARIVLCDAGHGRAERAAGRLEAIDYRDVGVLDGGTRAWSDAGFALFAGVNVPSKLFGELVEHAYHTPRVTVEELATMQARHDDVIVVDGRPFAEYRKMNIPGGICCPNAELPYRIRDIVKNPKTKIVVNCAGRTRSILGAQTLINFGVPNPVYALENGTQGWVLSNRELERGADRRYPERVDSSALPALQAQARALMQRFGVRQVSASEARAWLDDPNRTTYLLDVRTPEEFAAGSLAGAVHAPGGQLIQATDQWVGVRNARMVVFDGENVRAPVVASWLVQLGCDAYVLEHGVRAPLEARVAAKPEFAKLRVISAAELARMLAANACTAIDLGASMRYRSAHVPKSRWSIRPKIVEACQGARTPIVLIADEPDIASLAAIDLREAGIDDVQQLDGGVDAWQRAGLPLDATPDLPADRECIDYLFFVHDRHAGNREAMKQYLAWETGLIAQLDSEDRKLFRVDAT